MNRPDQPGDAGAPDTMESHLRDEHLRGLGLMLAGFAHELNTPLAVVASQCESLGRCRGKLADIIAKPTLTADDHEALRGILAHMEQGDPVLATGLDRLQALVRELRLAARPDGFGDPEPVALVDVIEGDLILLQHLVRQGVTVERQYEAHPTVAGRPALLGQVFLNILRNAVQAMDGRGTLTITVGEDGGRAVVTVADTGPGLSEEILGILFARQFTTKCPETGTGLGLFMSHKVLAKHDGTIAAANRPEGGAVFTVTLPVV